MGVKMSEPQSDKVTCVRIPCNLEAGQRARIDDILNKAAGGDYVAYVARERLVEPDLGFTVNECSHDLCLNFKIATAERVALNVRGVEFLPASSAKTMNLLRG